ncbi:MAG: flavodoxin family protein [Candidatus Hodarchaeota archaeon]
MKPLIIYYTFSGRTKRVAKIIGEALSEYNPSYFSVEIKGKFGMMDALEKGDYSSIEDGLNSLQSMDFDTIIIGMPTWGNRPPKVFNEILARLPGIDGKRAFVFTTSIFSGGGTLKYMKEKVEEKGPDFISERKFRAAFWIRKANVVKFASEIIGA